MYLVRYGNLIRLLVPRNVKKRVIFLNMVMAIFLTAILLSTFISKHQNPEEVIFVSVIFRHGDRTPKERYTYSTDPYRDKRYWPEGLDALTNLGKVQLFELGKWLRKRYSTLLSEHYDPGNVYVRSTDVDRTLMSAQANLAGMFPPDGRQVWHKNLPWQPVPIHTVPYHDDILAGGMTCPEYNKEREKVMNSLPMKELNQRFTEIYKVLKENIPEFKNDIYQTYGIFSTLSIETRHNLTLPEWTKKIFPQPMGDAAKHRYILDTYTPKLARLKSGLLIKELINTFKNKLEGKTTRNVHLYSGHGTTIANLLNSLGMFDLQIPPYATCLMIELRVDQKKRPYVAVFFKNYTDFVTPPYLLTMPGCSPYCPLDWFVYLTEPLIPRDWNKECFT